MSDFNINNLVDDFIKKERGLEPNPFLATRIMSKIERQKIEPVWKIGPAWARLAVASAFVLVVSGGFVLGKAYNATTSIAQTLIIDDGRIENISYYNDMIAD